jgi:hypothetical protein
MFVFTIVAVRVTQSLVDKNGEGRQEECFRKGVGNEPDHNLWESLHSGEQLT